MVRIMLFNNQILRKACASAALLLGLVWTANADVITYSGRLLNSSGSPVVVATEAEFSFFESPTDGSALADYRYRVNLTPNADGIYSVAIGDMESGVGGAIPAAIFNSPKVYLNVKVGGENLVPRARLGKVGHAFRADSANIAVSARNAGEAGLSWGLAGGTFIMATTTGTAVQNGQSLLAAYQKAKTLLPNQAPLSSSNRATLLIPPGRYDLGTEALTLDKEFVDVIGLSSSSGKQEIFGVTNGNNSGVLMQKVNDVRIENLTVICTRSQGEPIDIGLYYLTNFPAAYYPDAPSTTETRITNCTFKTADLPQEYAVSMRIATDYEGEYRGCVGGDYSFGYEGDAKGVFINCSTGHWSFGTFAEASGTFTNCHAGDLSFGGGGLASGDFQNCVAGYNSFGSTASGRFNNCVGNDMSFGFLGTASGIFTHCTGGGESFAAEGIASGVFTNCTGGNYSFGGGIGGDTTGGKFRYCVGGMNSFGNGTNERLYCIRNGSAL